jgi:hypothetical protein
MRAPLESLAFVLVLAVAATNGNAQIAQPTPVEADTDQGVPRRMAVGFWQLPDTSIRSSRQVPPARSCGDLAAKTLSASTRVTNVELVEGGGRRAWCRVTVESTHPPAKNVVTSWIGLPLENWNGRFLGLGGGGFQAGIPKVLANATALGFAAAATDAGHPIVAESGPFSRTAGDGSFALGPDGRLDWSAVRNFAHVGIHDMTVAGKAVTREFYGEHPTYAYFSGCSTGGRQGQSEVQRYPGDYDGVLSGAPAVNWAHFIPAGLWPQLVMQERRPVPECKFETVRRAAIAACDRADGVSDGVITDPAACTFDPKSTIGTHTSCGTITTEDAEVIRLIWEGPRRQDGTRLWYGLDRGATFEFGASTAGTPLAGEPNPIVYGWFQYFLKQNPQWNMSKLSHSEYEQLFDQSVEQYSEVFDTSKSDVRAYANRGGKTIIWHGLKDSNFPAAGTVQYVNSIRQVMGAARSDSFLRFYLAPGATHCGEGEGAQPFGLLEKLIIWVELGKAPQQASMETLDVDDRRMRTGLLCPYPQSATLRGNGSSRDAAAYKCTDPQRSSR